MYHDLIFEAAEQTFAEKGFGTETIPDVAAEAGISLQRGVHARLEFLAAHQSFPRILLRGGRDSGARAVEEEGAQGVANLADIRPARIQTQSAAPPSMRKSEPFT